MPKIFLLTSMLFIYLNSNSQSSENQSIKKYSPYAGVLAAGCTSNPFSVMAGVQKELKPHLRLAYDIHYFNTKYEDRTDNVFSEGHFRSVTPSVKLFYNTGKRSGTGLYAGIGLGFMIAKDRGTEQTYYYDAQTGTYSYEKDYRTGNWDFTTISPSFTIGYGFSICHFPVGINNVYYFGKDTKGWAALVGGAGISFGFKRI